MSGLRAIWKLDAISPDMLPLRTPSERWKRPPFLERSKHLSLLLRRHNPPSSPAIQEAFPPLSLCLSSIGPISEGLVAELEREREARKMAFWEAILTTNSEIDGGGELGVALALEHIETYHKL